MATGETGRSGLTRRNFRSHDQTIAATSDGKFWTLTLGDRDVRTRDLSQGVDELLGPARANLALVLSILEAQAEADDTTGWRN